MSDKLFSLMHPVFINDILTLSVSLLCALLFPYAERLTYTVLETGLGLAVANYTALS